MSVRLKARKSIVSAPLPKRNREEAILRRIGAAITNQAELDAQMVKYPHYLRAQFREKLAPYLRFAPGAPTIESSGAV
jgi:hypothetical protein